MAAHSPLVSVQRLVDAVLGVSNRAVLQVNAHDAFGSVFVDGGRISWAAVPQTRRFLSERLAANGVRREVIDAARTENRPLSDLVRTGVITKQAFTTLLFDHSVESLDHLVSHSIGSIKVVPWTRPAAPEYSFPALSMLTEIAMRHAPMPDVHEPPVSSDLTAIAVVNRDDVLVPVRTWGRQVPELKSAMELITHGAAVMQRMGDGTVSFRRGNRSWSVSGNRSAFVVSSGNSPLSFSWMLGQP